MQAFSGKPKLEVRVPHARGLPMTDHIKYGEEAESMQWIGVDLDGTLAQADPWQGFEHIGKPIPNMMKRVKIWLELGYRVKIVTAGLKSLIKPFRPFGNGSRNTVCLNARSLMPRLWT